MNKKFKFIDSNKISNSNEHIKRKKTEFKEFDVSFSLGVNSKNSFGAIDKDVIQKNLKERIEEIFEEIAERNIYVLYGLKMSSETLGFLSRNTTFIGFDREKKQSLIKKIKIVVDSSVSFKIIIPLVRLKNMKAKFYE